MTTPTTVSRWPAMGLALLCSAVTGYLLFGDVARGDVPMTSAHVLNGTALVLAIAAGHYTLLFWGGRRRTLALLCGLGGIIASVLVLATGIARNAEGQAAKVSAAGDRDLDRGTVRSARAELASIPAARPVPEIEALILPLAAAIGKADCASWVRDTSVRAACVDRNRLVAERARSERRAALEQIAAGTVAPAIQTGGLAHVAGMLARWSGASEVRVGALVSDLLTVGPVLTVELFAALFWVVALSPARRSGRPAPGSENRAPISGPDGQPSGSSGLSGPGRAGQSGWTDGNPGRTAWTRETAARSYSKTEAHTDYLALVAAGARISQSDLITRWGSKRSTVSDWLKEWRAPRTRRGRKNEIGRTDGALH